MENTKIIESRQQFVTVKQAVKSTGLSEHFIREGLRNGRIPHLKVGVKYLINLPQFVEWLNAETQRVSVSE